MKNKYILYTILLVYLLVIINIKKGCIYRSNNYLTGGDARHVSDDFTDVLIAKYIFSKNIPNSYYDILFNRLLKFIENNPKHPICIKKNIGKYKYDYFETDNLKKE